MARENRVGVFVRLAIHPADALHAQVIDILHSFVGGANDGQNPDGAFRPSGSTFFGMTPEAGGAGGDGTIFQMGINGAGFSLTQTDSRGFNGHGRILTISLIQSGNNVYGMTQFGGHGQ